MGLFNIVVVLLLLSGASNAFGPHRKYSTSSQLPLFSVVGDLMRDPESFNANDNNDGNTGKPHLVFPGGGLFFYWQAGTVTYLREQGYDMNQITASGASAGALTATLMATNVDFLRATELALQLSDEAGVWDRSGGLQGIWGPMIEEWLDQLLPENAAEIANHRLSLLVTTIPSFGKEKVSNFRDKQDLIDCNMASVHLPWFLDGKLTANFRNRPHVDGSFLARAPDYLPQQHRPSSILRVDWNKDPVYQNGEYLDFIKVISKDGIWKILEQGKTHAKIMEEQGRFRRLPKLQLSERIVSKSPPEYCT